MKKILSTLILVAVTAAPAFAETSVGVSIGINQPGVYGRVDIGNFPPPPVVYAEPKWVHRPAVRVQREPMYLYVPPGHQRNWGRHCKRYDACGQPVYFVQERWVKKRYDDHHRRGGHKGKGRGHDRGDDHRGHDRDDDNRGHGRGRG